MGTDRPITAGRNSEAPRRPAGRAGKRAPSGRRASAPKSAPWRELLNRGRSDGRLVRHRRRAQSAGSAAPIPIDELHPELTQALMRSGIEQLHSHQAQSLAAAWDSQVIVTTGTASGKTLCFNLPTLEVLCRDRRARALYLYPTKALAQDQLRSLLGLGMEGVLRPAIYDGDTPKESRAQVRKSANLLLTNPEMLHQAILPNHELWADFFANLAIVVIDEAHVYRGVFGSHVANVLRRLRRIADAHGTAPRFLLTSATIANPMQLAQRLTGLNDFQVIGSSGAPLPARDLAIWNPPLIGQQGSARRAATTEAAELVCSLLEADARVICFARSRRSVELLARAVSERLIAVGRPELAAAVSAYRAGYTAQQRRALEQRLSNGELRAIVTTNALELGIDVGKLDAAVVVGFPGTMASLLQMWGRAGRGGRGLALYIAGEDALDQYFCRHPDELLDRPAEAAILDFESPQIRSAHLRCAARELPLSAADTQFLGGSWQQAADLLVSEGALAKRSWLGRQHASGTRRAGTLDGTRYVPRFTGDYPAGEVSLRSISSVQFSIMDVSTGELLGTLDGIRAQSALHAGAIYLHMGAAYEVMALDSEHAQAAVRPFDGDWHTQSKRDTQTNIDRVLQQRRVLGVEICFGELSVTEQVLGFERKRNVDHSRIGYSALDCEPLSFRTQGLWFKLHDDLLNEAGRLLGEPEGASPAASEWLLGALHAVEHAQIAVLPLLAMCDRWDIGGLSTNLHPQTSAPTIFIFDAHPGGIGISRAAFERFERLCTDALRLIDQCGCSHGCPSCVQSPKCGNLNEPLSKGGAALILGAMLGACV